MYKLARERQAEAAKSAAQRRRAEEDAEEDRIEEEARQQRLAEEEAARQAEEARLRVRTLFKPASNIRRMGSSSSVPSGNSNDFMHLLQLRCMLFVHTIKQQRSVLATCWPLANFAGLQADLHASRQGAHSHGMYGSLAVHDKVSCCRLRKKHG